MNFKTQEKIADCHFPTSGVPWKKPTDPGYKIKHYFDPEITEKYCRTTGNLEEDEITEFVAI